MPATKVLSREEEEANAAAAIAMAKLTREKLPVKILRNPYQLARVREDLAAMKESKQYVSKRSWVSAFFRRTALDTAPLEDKIKAFEALEGKLAGEYIEGYLTPLKEAEVWEVRVEVAAIIKALRAREKDFTGESLAGYKVEVDNAVNTIWASKWVEFAFKKLEQVNGAWVRYYKPGETVHAPEVVDYLYVQYHEGFTLTEEELKKSVASTPAAS